MEMVLPASYAVIEEEEMMYLDGGFYISNRVLKTTLLSVGMNPMSGVAAAVLIVGIKKVGTALGAKLGLAGGVAGSVFGGIIGFSIATISAKTIAHALIQGKGIDISLRYSKWGIPYGVGISVK